jgi:hypothetical protein
MKIVATGKSEQNQAAIDPWTLVHLGFGVATGMMGMSLPVALFAAVAYEVAEQAFERTEAGQKLFVTSGPETPANSLVDVAVYMAGWYWATRWSNQ